MARDSNSKKSLSETDIMNSIRVALTRLGCRLWRNQVGRYNLPDGTWIRSGLCLGSSDLIGITSQGRFLAIEVKRPGEHVKPGGDQENFLNQIIKLGGIAYEAHSEEEAVDKFRELEGGR